MAEAVETSADEVTKVFLRGETANTKFEAWRSGRARKRVGVIDTVMGHRTSALYQLTPASVDETLSRSDHPLGEIVKHKVANIKLAKNWYPTFAFTHLVHYLLEARGELPTWQDFRKFFIEDAVGLRMLGGEAGQRRDLLVTQGVEKNLARDAMTWRVGNAYYGILRDIFTVVHLRAYGVDARAHPLADALFRTDAWVQNTVLSVRVRNPEFASGLDGRKLKPEDLLGDASPRFHFHALELEPATKFGVIHLPAKESIRAAAEKLAGV